MVTVGAVQEGLAPLALLARRLEDAARWRVQGAPAAREPIFQVEAEGRNREVTSGSRGVDRLSHPPWSPAPAHRPRPRRSGVGLCFSLWGWRSEGMWGAGEPTQPLRTRAALHRTGFASHNCDSTLRGPDALSWLPTHVVLTHIQRRWKELGQERQDITSKDHSLGSGPSGSAAGCGWGAVDASTNASGAVGSLRG